MQKLHERYEEQGLRVLGFPCNQFGGQDPGTNAEILEFAQTNYGVNFPMHAKIEVNGSGAHPLYQYLKGQAGGILGTSSIKWNFTKFTVDRGGKVRNRHAPKTKPENLIGELEDLLGNP